MRVFQKSEVRSSSQKSEITHHDSMHTLNATSNALPHGNPHTTPHTPCPCPAHADAYAIYNTHTQRTTRDRDKRQHKHRLHQGLTRDSTCHGILPSSQQYVDAIDVRGVHNSFASFPSSCSASWALSSEAFSGSLFGSIISSSF